MNEPAAVKPPSIEERITAAINRDVEQPPVQEVENVEDAASDEITESASEVQAQEAPAEPTPDETPEVAESGTEEGESIEVSSLPELMEQIGAEPESMYDLTFPVTIDGKRQDMSLSEIKDSVKATKDAMRFKDEAKAIRDAAQQSASEAEERLSFQLAQAHQLAEGLDKAYLSRFEGINWQELREVDPAEYAAKRQELAEAQEAVNAQKSTVANEVEQFKAQAAEQQQAAMMEVRTKELDALHAAWPELADEEKGPAERSAMIDYLKTRGFDDQEIGSAMDHRLFLMARDAMRFQVQAKSADAAKKKVIKIGKRVIKPGAKQTKSERATEALQPLRDRLKKSGKMEDAAALLSQSRRR